MRIQSRLAWAVLASAVALGACGKSNAAGGGLRDSVDDFQDLALEHRAELESTLQAQLDAARDALADFAVEAREQGEQGRVQVVEELRREEQLARAKFEALRGAGADEWKRLCRETQSESRRLADQAKALFDDG